MLERYSYLQIPQTADLPLADCVRALLEANGRPKTRAHVFAVAEAARALARRFGVDAEVCAQAALLHDISAVIRPADMLAYMEESGAYLDPAERAHPFLLHQRVSRLVAAEDFGIADGRVLSAIEVHTTLKADYSPCDLIVYLADKLAWDQPGEPPYRGVVEAALEVSLAGAALAHIEFALANGMILQPHKWLLEARAALQAEVEKEPA